MHEDDLFKDLPTGEFTPFEQSLNSANSRNRGARRNKAAMFKDMPHLWTDMTGAQMREVLRRQYEAKQKEEERQSMYCVCFFFFRIDGFADVFVYFFRIDGFADVCVYLFFLIYYAKTQQKNCKGCAKGTRTHKKKKKKGMLNDIPPEVTIPDGIN